MSESTQVAPTEEPQQQQNSSSILKCLVIDTNAIINGVSLRTMAEEFYTCPEVLYELRSAHSKEFLSRLPFELKILNPTEEAMKTGNFQKDRSICTFFINSLLDM
jgi:rRNA maturation endonuclease Nob1